MYVQMESKSIISILFILQVIINGINLTIVNSKEDRHLCRGGDFKSNAIGKNRASAFDKLLVLIKNSTTPGFLHTQVGDKPEEQVTVSFLCSGNVKVKGLCECGFNKLVAYLLKGCPKQNEGVAWNFYWYFTVMVRYSTGRKIISVLDDWAWHHHPDPEYVKAIALEKTLDGLVSKLKEQAAGGDAVQKYASGTTNYDGEEHALYAAVQCTPDLTKGDCIKCLSKASNEIHSCCTSKPLFAGRVISTNCFVWYAHVTFFKAPSRFGQEACS